MKHSEQKNRSLKYQHVKNNAKDVDGPVVDKMLGMHNLLMAVLQTQKESSVYLSKIKFPVLIHRLIREGEYPNKNLPSLRDHGSREKRKIREAIEHFRKFQTVPHTLCNTDTTRTTLWPVFSKTSARWRTSLRGKHLHF